LARWWGTVRFAHDDPGLGGGDAAAASELANGLIEVCGVSAGELDDVVEAARYECHLLRRWQRERESCELLGVGRGQQSHVDVRGQAAPELALVHTGRVSLDGALCLHAPHAFGDGVGAESDVVGDLRECRASVSDEDADDSVVDSASHGRNLSICVPDLANRTGKCDACEMAFIGVPAEIKTDEHRVGLTPAGVRELVARGHEVVVQAGAGEGSAIADAAYAAQGATILPDADRVFAAADVVVKVKEPQTVEVDRLRAGQILFTYLHLAPDPQLTAGLLASGATCIAYETVTDASGRLPLLAPMSEVAGKIATQAGAFMLEKPMGGRGMLLGGVPGVAAGRVMVIGGGVVGQNAAQVAIGMGAEVYVLDRNIDRLRDLETMLGNRASTVYASTLGIEQLLPEVDLVIGAVLVHGARAPRVITREHLALMKQNAVLVDVSIDQGGCFETSRPTTHSDPTYEVDGVTHYCVANMPGAVPITSTYALTNATLPYVVKLCDLGVLGALQSDPGFLDGLATFAGRLTSAPVALDQGLDWTPPAEALERDLVPA